MWWPPDEQFQFYDTHYTHKRLKLFFYLFQSLWSSYELQWYFGDSFPYIWLWSMDEIENVQLYVNGRSRHKTIQLCSHSGNMEFSFRKFIFTL